MPWAVRCTCLGKCFPNSQSRLPWTMVTGAISSRMRTGLAVAASPACRMRSTRASARPCRTDAGRCFARSGMCVSETTPKVSGLALPGNGELFFPGAEVHPCETNGDGIQQTGGDKDGFKPEPGLDKS